MPRKRMIDPSIWEDLTIGQLSRDARLCFIGMLSYADDEGRVQVDPRYVKRAIFGFDDDLSAADVAAILGELRANVDNLVFYAAEGRQIAAFLNWRRYQYIQKPQGSTLPAPPIVEQSENNSVPITDEYDNGIVPVAPNRIEKKLIEPNRTERARNDDGGGGERSVLKIRNEEPDERSVAPKLREIGLTMSQTGKVLAAQPRTLRVSVEAWGQWIACHRHGEDGIKNPVSYAYTGLLAGNLPELADDPAELAAEEKKRAGLLKQREVSRFAQAPPRQPPPAEPLVPREELSPQQIKAFMRSHNPLKAMSNGQVNPYQTPGPDDDRGGV